MARESDRVEFECKSHNRSRNCCIYRMWQQLCVCVCEPPELRDIRFNPKLQSLDLSNCQIASIDESTIFIPQSLKDIDLSDNPQCPEPPLGFRITTPWFSNNLRSLPEEVLFQLVEVSVVQGLPPVVKVRLCTRQVAEASVQTSQPGR